MRVYLVAVGEKMPDWVQQGFNEYAKRLSRDCRLELIVVPAARRGKNTDLQRARAEEADRLLAAVPKGARIIVLDEKGQGLTTVRLAQQLGEWLQGGSDIALLVGGPDGLADRCKDAAQQSWSLSPLTLPHPLVRVVVAEQIYRAWSHLRGHPYHRE